MINALKKVFVLSLLLTTAAAYAQVAPSVTGGQSTLWAGGEYSYFQPDYGGFGIHGIGALVDYGITPKIAAIGEARFLRFGNSGDGGETQSDYLVGASYQVYRYRRLSVYPKFLLGGVWIKFPLDIGSGSYFALAPGGFVDYRISTRFLARGGYEYQILPSAPNIPGQPSGGLTPHGFTVGVEYRVFGVR